MGAICERVCVKRSGIPVESIGGLQFGCTESAVDKKLNPNWSTRRNRRPDNRGAASNVAPLAMLVEIVFVAGGGVGAEAEVVAQASLECLETTDAVKGAYPVTVSAAVRQVGVGIRALISRYGCER